MTRSFQPKPPAVAIILQNGLPPSAAGLGRGDTRVTADLVNPGGGWPTTGTSLLRWPLTISHLGTDSKDLIGWYGVSESGNVAE